MLPKMQSAQKNCCEKNENMYKVTKTSQQCETALTSQFELSFYSWSYSLSWSSSGDQSWGRSLGGLCVGHASWGSSWGQSLFVSIPYKCLRSHNLCPNSKVAAVPDGYLLVPDGYPPVPDGYPPVPDGYPYKG